MLLSLTSRNSSSETSCFFWVLAFVPTCFLNLCRVTKVPLILSNLWCKSSVLLANVSLTWSFWDMYLSWQNMAAVRENLSSSNELCSGIPWTLPVYIFLGGYAGPPKTKLCNVILFHCFTTNRRKCQILLIGLCCFSSFLHYFMLLPRKSTHAHKFLHLPGNILEWFLVPVKDHKEALNEQIKSGTALHPKIGASESFCRFIFCNISYCLWFMWICQEEPVGEWENWALMSRGWFQPH